MFLRYPNLSRFRKSFQVWKQIQCTHKIPLLKRHRCMSCFRPQFPPHLHRPSNPHPDSPELPSYTSSWTPCLHSSAPPSTTSPPPHLPDSHRSGYTVDWPHSQVYSRVSEPETNVRTQTRSHTHRLQAGAESRCREAQTDRCLGGREWAFGMWGLVAGGGMLEGRWGARWSFLLITIISAYEQRHWENLHNCRGHSIGWSCWLGEEGKWSYRHSIYCRRWS